MAAVFGAAGSRGKCMEIPESQAPSDLLPGAACHESAGLSSVKEHRAMGCGAELSCGSQESDILLCHYSAWLQRSCYMSPPQSHLPRPLNLKWPPHQPPSIPLPVRLLHSARCCRGPAFRSGPLLFLPRPCHLYVSREGSDSPMWVFQASEPPLVCGCLAPGPLGTDSAVSAGGAPAVGQTGGCGAAPPMEALPPSSPVSGLWIPPQVLSPRTGAHGTRRGPAGHTPTAGSGSNRDGPSGTIRSRPSLRARPAPFTETLLCARPPHWTLSVSLPPGSTLLPHSFISGHSIQLVPEHPSCPSRHFLDTSYPGFISLPSIHCHHPQLYMACLFVDLFVSVFPCTTGPVR